ncbi:MAG TPA: YdeI/OmpD-associated family protein [Cytophagaceae bacterium]|jgi:tRNA isopentenyl-2-thiomethyl-A-37 hydroxylase MiaE
MIEFKETVKKFGIMGEKTGWTYIDIPLDLAEQLMPNTRKAFRVKGKIDDHSFSGVSLVPIGEGNYILAINATMRKAIKKQQGDKVLVKMELDLAEMTLSTDLLECLENDQEAKEYFFSLTKGHQRYFSNWIESAKTISTKTKRIAQSLNALSYHLSYSEMIRSNKKKTEE